MAYLLLKQKRIWSTTVSSTLSNLEKRTIQTHGRLFTASFTQLASNNNNVTSSATTTAATTDGIVLTERAKKRMEELRKLSKEPALKLRLAVEGGGCSGFSYKFSTSKDDPVEGEDKVFSDGMLHIDTISLDLVKGAKIDFTEDLIRRSFQVVDNPLAESKCGCGSSFAVKGPKSI